MGSYLSEPVTEKVTDDSEFKSISAGEASMQGWRVGQEDAHNVILNFDDELKSAFFAIYDGHGGAEVAQLAAQRLPEMLMECNDYKSDIVSALEHTFVQFDRHILEPDVLKRLTAMAGVETDNEDESGSETALLNEDAQIPLSQLIANYNIKNVNGKKNGTSSSDGSNRDKITMNGQQAEDGKSQSKNETRYFASVSNGGTGSSSIFNQCTGGAGGSAAATGSSASASGSSAAATGSSAAATGSSAEAGGSAAATGSSSHTNDSICSSGAGGDSWSKSNSVDSKPSSSQSSKITSRILNEDESDEEDDSEDDSENEFESGSDDNDDTSGDSGDEEIENMTPISAFQHSGEAGYDSGCTAVVAVLRDRRLYVANAGDSRCVVSRSGVAMAMSEDHKPEDQGEKARIQAAGGSVSKDGRVNSSLNLSRALGDHAFKNTLKLPLVDQMISSLPDVRTLDLDTRDEFIILACDGIWNVMTNQEVVTFVIEKMSLEPKPKLSEVCGMLFDYCIAPNTSGECIGCDNMSAIIVDLRKSSVFPAAPEPTKDVGVELQKTRYVKIMPIAESEDECNVDVDDEEANDDSCTKDQSGETKMEESTNAGAGENIVENTKNEVGQPDAKKLKTET